MNIKLSEQDRKVLTQTSKGTAVLRLNAKPEDYLPKK